MPRSTASRKTKDAHQVYKKLYYARHRKNATNSRKSWTIEEELRVLNHEIFDSALSKEIGRSVFAIQLKRHRLKA